MFFTHQSEYYEAHYEVDVKCKKIYKEKKEKNISLIFKIFNFLIYYYFL